MFEIALEHVLADADADADADGYGKFTMSMSGGCDNVGSRRWRAVTMMTGRGSCTGCLGCLCH